MRFRRTLYGIALLAISAAAFFAPEAAAFIKPNTPAPLTLAVERVSYTAPVTDAATVLIQRPGSKGTGFHIGGGRIITAAHVVDGARTVSIKSYDGRISSATVVMVDAGADIAFLETKMRLLAAELSCDMVPVGEPITSIGNPLGQEFITAFGRIAGEPRAVSTGRSVYVTDITTVMGQSGSAVFARGKVIGVISAVMVAPMRLGDNYVPSLVGFGYVVPSPLVCEMLGRVG